MKAIISKATAFVGTAIILLGLIKPIITLIRELEEAIKGEKLGEERKQAIMDSIRTVVEGLIDLFGLDLPTDFIMNIVDKLIEIIFAVLKRTGNLEPEPTIEGKKGDQNPQ